MLQIEGMYKGMEETAKIYDSRKADNIAYNQDTNTAQLTANGELIGTPVVINSACEYENGIPAVDIGDKKPEPEAPSDEYNNVIDF